MGRRGRKTWVLHKIVMQIGGVPLVIPINTVEDIADKGAVLSIMNRLKEREALQRAGFPVPEYTDEPSNLSDSYSKDGDLHSSEGEESVSFDDIVTEPSVATGDAPEDIDYNYEWTRLWKNKKGA